MDKIFYSHSDFVIRHIKAVVGEKLCLLNIMSQFVTPNFQEHLPLVANQIS